MYLVTIPLHVRPYNWLSPIQEEPGPIWNRNQEVSPFLRLPPEIRNRIYEFTFYVGIIKVDHRPTRYVYKDGRVTSSRTRDDLREIIPGGFFCHRLPIDRNPFVDHEPAKPPPRGMTLLSPVCRQLYHETSAIPFALNHWCFERPWMLDRYILRERRLPRAQRRAFRVLYLDGRLADEVLRLLTGLEFLISPLNGSKRELVTNYITRQGDTIRQSQKGPLRWHDNLKFNLYEAGTVS
ncbi:hypothetical protein DL546_001315 [Coniochaeta pulveracea]|uniref:Uncharacterized protein n=1 Tax=Coniochaeta pulveracea TaxID=177199 RepID=A0A420YFM0_9PEZI|nr:hypothetical protein DL546_001315 [Coniochaeta pulveracea]